MAERRLVGMTWASRPWTPCGVLDENGEVVAKRKAWPTVESLNEVETAALAGCDDSTRLEVMMEPTGPAWLQIAVFFAEPWPPGPPGLLDQGSRSAPVHVAPHEDQRDRR